MATRTDFYFTSSTGDCEIHAAKWEGAEKRAVFQINHGMAEHIERYEGFAEFLADNGFVVYANDHIGHGKSINGTYKPGFFGMDNTEGAVFADDCKLLTDIAKEENPGLPYFFFGHSMGSFVARRYAALYGDGINGLVVCGTGGPNPACGIAILLDDIISKFKGVEADGKFINTLAFGSYNKRTEKVTEFDWLTKDTDIVDKYINDPLCGFLFSNRGFRDMLSLLKFVNSADCYNATRKDLPIFLVAGAEDPVGPYGKGVETVYNTYLKNGNPAEIKLYEGDRHEILNELDKDQVMADILTWCNKLI